MASHYHHHPHHHQPNHSSCTCCTCNCSSPQPPHQPISTDPILQAFITSQLLQTQLHFMSQPPQVLKRQYNIPHHCHKLNQPILASLCRRLDSLEATFETYISPSTSLNEADGGGGRVSLRDHAARIIQRRYRAVLVRRSRTLRELKGLALLKGSVGKLEYCVLKGGEVDLREVLEKGMDLLTKIDSIQGRDLTIREGKISISKELVQFLESVGGVSVRKVAVKNVNVKFNREKKEVRGVDDTHLRHMKSLSDRIRKIEGISTAYVDSGEEDYVEQGMYSKDMDLRKLSDRVRMIEEFSRAHEDDEEEAHIERRKGYDDVQLKKLLNRVEKIEGLGRAYEDDEEARIEKGRGSNYSQLKKLRDRIRKIERVTPAHEDDKEDSVELEGFQHHISDDEEEDKMPSSKFDYLSKNAISELRKGILIKGQEHVAKARKRVSFVEDGKVVSQGFINPCESILNGGDGQIELVESSGSEEGEDVGISEVFKVNKDDDQRALARNKRAVRVNDGDKKSEMNMKSKVRYDSGWDHVFSPPLPVEMEPRKFL